MPVTLGVVGDSHANLDMLYSAAAIMRDRHGARHFIHLGDYYRDGMALRKQGFDVVCVPGLQCPAYGGSERVMHDTIEGYRVVAAHTPDDLKEVCHNADLCLHGHTHAPYVLQKGRAVWLNPGHLKNALDRGERPSYAIVTLEPGLLRALIQGLGGELIAEEAFNMPLAPAHG